MRYLLTTLLFTVFTTIYSQETRVYGLVVDAATNEPLDFVTIAFVGTDISMLSMENGRFDLVCPFKSDSLVISNYGYITQKIAIKRFEEQEINLFLKKEQSLLDAVVIQSAGDPPAIRLLKKVIQHKPENNREKLDAYQYQVYTKTQMDLVNLTDKFKKRDLVKRLDFVLDYLDSVEDGSKYLPVMLSESMSDFYYKKSPKQEREIVHATRMAGIPDMDINHLFGEMFLDINFYDNYVKMFNRSFVSPISAYGRGFYNYTLLDSAYIDNQFSYLLSFQPKRSGGTTFEGEMWIHDSTFALKEITATLSSTANINFLHGIDIHQSFEQIQEDVWMLKDEQLKIRANAFQTSKFLNLLITKNSKRSEIKVNQILPDEFYLQGSNVTLTDSAKTKSEAYWETIRTDSLTNQEQGIYTMVDSLNNSPFWKMLYHFSEFFVSGYYPLGYVELGDLFNFVSVNPVEKLAFSIALRTSNKFSKTVELGGNIGYAIRNQRIKWGARIRVRVNPLRKWGMVDMYASTNLVQYGQAADLGSLFGSILKRSPLDKMFYEDKVGVNYEQDLGKNFNLKFTTETKFLTSEGLAKFERYSMIGDLVDVDRISTTEIGAELSWTIQRQFITAVYERKYIGSKFPIVYVKGLVGLKGIFGSATNYQKIEVGMDHIASLGVIGRLRYGVSAGKYFGHVPYPFLNLHDGGDTYYFSRKSFNTLGYFEFISDTYVTANFEHHFQGLIFNRIPLIKKLKWRLIVHGRAAWGTLSSKQNNALIIPEFTREFGKIPYVETGIGIGNIFKFFRVDMVYRATHQIPGKNPFGVRFRLEVQI